MNRFKEAVSYKIRLNLAFGQCKALRENIQGDIRTLSKDCGDTKGAVMAYKQSVKS